MRNFLAGLVFVGSIVLAIYLGFWVMFIGAIMEIARMFDAHTLTAMIVATNIIKIIFASFVGWITVVIGSCTSALISK
jgi:uncharacterized membrane protein